MKRFGVRARARYLGGGFAIVAFVAITLFVVLPAFASNPGEHVPPGSSAGVMPLDVGVGGNQSCTSAGLFPGMTGALQTTDPSPPSPGVTVSWPSGQGWNFTLTSGTLTGLSGNPNKIQSLSVDSNGHAAILGIAIKGGTDNLAYDYRPTAKGWVSNDSNLHAPASKFTSGDPETGISQYYGISQLVICYETPLTTISGNAYKDISGKPGIGGLTVTLVDTTTQKTQTTTTSTSASTLGNYSFSAAPGDNYTVCISKPTGFGNVQTVPATDGTGGACAAGTNGYSITNLSGDQTSENFGFQPLGSVSGTVYTDVNGPKGGGPDGVFESGTDTTLGGWTVTLYDGSGNVVGSPTTSGTNGQYSFTASFDTSQTYTVCVTPANPPGGMFGQSEPLPTAPNSCATLSGLQKGQQFTPSSASANVTENFGVDPAVPEPCPPPSPFGGDQTNGELQIQLATCKPQTFVFNSGTLSDGTTPFVSVWASDQTQPKVPLIEKILFPDPIVSGTPEYTGLSYTDDFPYDPAAAEPMAFCKLDPRDPGDPNGMTLTAHFQGDNNKGEVLPATNAGTQTPATTCAISIRTFVDAGGKTWLEAYAYSDIDGFTKPH